MAFYVTYRSFPRPSLPQPNFKGDLNLTLWEAPLTVPSVTAQQVERTRDRVTDKTYVIETAPQPAWIFANLPVVTGPTTAQIAPALWNLTTLPAVRPGLDVRAGAPPTNHWTTAVTGDIWAVGSGGYFAPMSRPGFDPRQVTAPSAVYTTGTVSSGTTYCGADGCGVF